MRILFQGDSITDCGRHREAVNPNVGLGAGYAMLAAGRLLADRPDKNIRVFNRGISGNRVVDLYARWKIDALNLKPDLLSILIGVNDTWHSFGSNNGVEVERYGRIYHEILTWTRQELPKVKIVLCEPFVLEFGAVTAEWHDEINARREIVRNLCQEFELAFVPIQSRLNAALTQAPPEYWLTDGVHPTLAGHQLLADEWLKVTRNFF
ncbi:MAG: SGNH/GDSL hydrolase family protein [Victivallaceae bacterium]|nr:SGNH/GDSL hydrolase family protein [Victivallaceae bacterium]